MKCYRVLKRLKIKFAQARLLYETTLERQMNVGIFERLGAPIFNAKEQPG